MKKITVVLFLMMILSTLVSCAVRQSAAAAGLSREWMLVAFKNYKKEDLMKAKASVDLSKTEENANRFAAYMGCNRMFFTADFKPNGAVKFSDVGSTMMYCDKMMDLETQFAKELPQMTRYKIEGHFLTLSAENGEKMKFVAEDWD